MEQTTETTSLAAFVAARLDELEAVAMAVRSAVDGLSSEPREPWRVERGRLYMTQGISLDMKPELARHIAANDPAATLARVAADRKILALHGPTDPWEAAETHGFLCGTCGNPWDEPAVAYPCRTLLALASQFAGHAGWDARWEG